MKIKVVLKSRVIIDTESNIEMQSFSEQMENAVEKKSTLCFTDKFGITIIPTSSIDYLKIEE